MDEDPQPAAPTDEPSSAGPDAAMTLSEEPTSSPTEAATMVADPEPDPTAEALDELAVEARASADVAEAVAAVEVAEAIEAVAVAEELAEVADAVESVAMDEVTADEPVADEPVAEVTAEGEPAAEVPVEDERPEPTTMAEFLDHPDHEVKNLRHGDVVEGVVVRIDPDELLVDFGGKSEGVVSNRELLGRRGGPREGDEPRTELKVGDPVLVYVLQPESPEGHAVLSVRRAGLERKWRAMQERFEAGEIVEARVIDHNKGGLIVDLGVRGFVPISQIVDFPRRPRDEQPRDAAQEIAEKLQPFVGRTLRLKILEVNRKANRLILSEKVAVYEERREKRDELFSSLNVGQRVQGTVRSIAPFGVFVDLGGIDGLVHKSELSWNKVNNPETAYEIGEQVEAEVIDINHERGRISLSIRRLQPDPWQESVAKYNIGDLIDGTVTKLVNFGAFVRIEEGLEGLIHISELSNSRVAHPGDVVQEGQQLKLKIISLDSERHRLGLSLKQTEDRSVPTVQPSYEMTELPGGDGENADRGPRPERAERTPERTDRADRPRSRDRRDRRDRDYRPEDATAEPEEGIDNTMAAAFAESGLLDQFRTDEPEAKPAPTEEATAVDAEAVPAVDAEAAPVVDAVAEEPAVEAEAPAAEVAEPAEKAADRKAAKPAAKARKKTAKAAPAEEPAAEEPPAETATNEASASSEPDKG
ncbi:MAG TPA: S1 RNA-binding domain-containing protein [Candidatus Limnocylindria bacterium]|nr:S1 RNA-binding domain-containing protein [Candidatus Limnocylindria bacterium]